MLPTVRCACTLFFVCKPPTLIPQFPPGTDDLTFLMSNKIKKLEENLHYVPSVVLLDYWHFPLALCLPPLPPFLLHYGSTVSTLLKPTPLRVHISHLLCPFKYFNSNFSTSLGYPSSSLTESFHQHANTFCIILIPFLFPVSPFLTPCPSQLLPISLLPFLLNSMKS